MLVQPINNFYNIPFEQKRYIDKKTYEQLRKLLPKINKQTTYVENDFNYKSSFLKELHVDDFTLIDGRTLLKQVPKDEQIQKETLIKFGKTQLVIDNKSGEIIDYYKPILKSWNTVLKTVSKNIEFIFNHFDNTNMVKRTMLNSNGLTEKGLIKQKKLNEDFAKYTNL